MESRLRRNAFYQTIYQILVTITPLITTPHLARALGAAGTGEYSYTLTYSSYFAMFVMLGVKDYGTRSIAMVSHLRKEKEKLFWEIYTFQFLCGVAATALYYSSCLMIDKYNNRVAFMQGLNIIASCLDINWFFFGIEKFKVTVSKNIIIKICTVACIIGFVNKDTGVFTYAAIMAGGTLISQVVLWFYLKKEINYTRPTWRGVITHIKPNLKLFIPVIAENVFHLMDKTMIGAISSYTELGYYYNADKMINIPKGIVNGLGTVFMARIAALTGSNEDKRVTELIDLSFEFHTFICCAIAFGIGAVSPEFVPWFFGAGYEPCIGLMVIFCPILIIKSYNIFIETEYFLPMKKEKYYSMAVITGACVNLVANLLLIPRLRSIGASLGTLVAESSVLLVLMISYIRTSKTFEFGQLAKGIPYFLFGAVMLVAVRAFSRLRIAGNVLNLFLEGIVGGLVYLVLCLLYWKLNQGSNFGRYIISLINKTVGRYNNE